MAFLTKYAVNHQVLLPEGTSYNNEKTVMAVVGKGERGSWVTVTCLRKGCPHYKEKCFSSLQMPTIFRSRCHLLQDVDIWGMAVYLVVVNPPVSIQEVACSRHRGRTIAAREHPPPRCVHTFQIGRGRGHVPQDEKALLGRCDCTLEVLCTRGSVCLCICVPETH